MKKNEQQILLGCLKNDRKAQRALYEEYKVQMFRLCLRYARDRQEAEDLLQEGFIAVFRDLKNYKGSGALGGWIRKVMVNNALQHIRKTKHHFQSIDNVQLSEYEEINIEEEDQSRVKELTKHLQSLPDGYRTVFNLYVIEGYTHKEIAKVLSISESTSKSQLFKAKGMLRKMLEKSMIS